uniref:Deoxynucleotide monophosphate kinase n=1 Tax=viral metagenome TaxID=1070528 RepID=A0A6C0C5R7_9ZZZZ
MKIIGLMGVKGSGKSTGSEYLISKYQYKEVAFADPLKKACQALFLFGDEQLFGTQEQKETGDPRWFNCSPRTAMQFVGTDLLRNNLDQIMPGLGNDIFTYNFKLRYEGESKLHPDHRIVISDVRFSNEAECIKSMGGIIIKIDRDLEVNDSHPSETDQKEIPYDYIIYNTGTIADYCHEIDRILSG